MASTQTNAPQTARQHPAAELFGEPIYAYSRRQAIEDGVLVDLMQDELAPLVREAGIRFPIAMTVAAFETAVAPIGRDLPAGQDLNGRLWDVLWILRCAIQRGNASDRVHFQVRVWNGRRHQLVKLWSLVGPGDNADPVITIMLEGED